MTVLRDGRFVCDAAVAEIDEDFLVSSMVGRTISDTYGTAPRALLLRPGALRGARADGRPGSRT